MKTLVIGASENPLRYSNIAIRRLVGEGHEVKALSLKKGSVAGIVFDTEKIPYENIDTVTLYIGKQHQPDFYEYIEELHPRRVIFNPETENPEFEEMLEREGIESVRACTLVLLSTGQY